jgi:hypothetical protein
VRSTAVSIVVREMKREDRFDPIVRGRSLNRRRWFETSRAHPVRSLSNQH